MSQYNKKMSQFSSTPIDSAEKGSSPPHPALQPTKISPKPKLKEDLQELAEALEASKITSQSNSNNLKQSNGKVDQGEIAAEKYLPNESMERVWLPIIRRQLEFNRKQVIVSWLIMHLD